MSNTALESLKAELQNAIKESNWLEASRISTKIDAQEKAREEAENWKKENKPTIDALKSELGKVESVDDLRDILTNYLAKYPAKKAGKKAKKAGKAKAGPKEDDRPNAGVAQKPAILDYIKANPGCKRSAIADSLNFSALSITPLIAALVEDRKIKKEGEKAGTKYTAI